LALAASVVRPLMSRPLPALLTATPASVKGRAGAEVEASAPLLARSGPSGATT